MDYALMFLTIFIFAAQTLLYKLLSKSFIRGITGYFVFNAIYCGVITGLLAALGVRFGNLHGLTAVLGVLYGVVFIATIFSYMKAMEHGPLSLSALIFALSLLVPVLFSAIAWNEGVSLLQCGALLLLFVTLYLCGAPAGVQEKKINWKWLCFSFMSFAGNGILMVLMKAHQKALPGLEINEFIVIAFGTASLLALAVSAAGLARKRSAFPQKKGLFLLLIVVTAVMTALGSRLTLYLSGRLPSVVQFPVVNGGVVLLSVLASAAAFKEKMTRKMWIALALGMAAIALLSL